MAERFTPGRPVQTPFGKGVVREVRNGGHLLVDVGGRALVVRDLEVTDVTVRQKRQTPGAVAGGGSVPAGRGARADAVEVDLHGLTVAEAVARADEAVNAACLADAATVRLIHGRSGGRIRAALHRRLREIPGVRGFDLDPGNAGVTVVRL